MSRLMEMARNAEHIAILGHVRPDGDCVGSCLAVCNYLLEQYPEKTVQVYLEKPADKFRYLKGFTIVLAKPSSTTAKDARISLPIACPSSPFPPK